VSYPIKNGKITFGFHAKYANAPGNLSGKLHQGVDFAVPIGTPVLACADGVVEGVNIWGPAYGDQAVVVKHMVPKTVGPVSFYVRKFFARVADSWFPNHPVTMAPLVARWAIYAHCNLAHVKAGDKVLKGNHIADSGNKGLTSGPHLHLEVQASSRWHDNAGLDPTILLGM
jgi:murein DD-endopeptidase MepM/ murein hydrolase activator NlpD